MNKVVCLCIAFLLILGLSSCNNQKSEGGKTTSNEKMTVSDITMEEGEKGHPEQEAIHQDEGKEYAFKVYQEYCRLAKEIGTEYSAEPLKSKEELITIENIQNLRKIGEYGYKFYELQERFPGKYAIYVAYFKNEENPELNFPSLCLYVNLHTKQVFQDHGVSGINKIPEDKIVVYIPYAFDGLNDNSFLIQVLYENRIIENKKDYGAEWLKFLIRDSEDEQDVSLNEETDLVPETSSDHTQDGSLEDGVIRIPVVRLDNEELIGTYDIHTIDRTVTDIQTGKILYEDPLTRYKEKKVTSQNAAKELMYLIKKLHEIDKKQDDSFVFDVQPLDLTEELNCKGYQVKIEYGNEDGSKRNTEYFISENGTKVAIYNEEHKFYELIYGCLMP